MSSTNTAEAISLHADIEIRAAENESNKPATAKILAYTGGPMRVGRAYPLVIDLASIDLPKSIPILADHRNSIDGLLGQGEPVAVDGRELYVNARLVRTAATQHLLGLANAGVSIQASVGLEAGQDSELQFVRDGESVRVNGRDHGGPVYIARKWTLRETSVVAVGADRNARTAIKARGGKVEMAENLSDDLGTERTRVEEIDAIIASNREQIGSAQADAIRSTAIESNLGVDATCRLVNAAALDRLRFARGRHTPGHSAGASEYGSPKDLLVAAALVATGEHEIAAKHIGGDAVEAAMKSRVGGLYELACYALQIEGRGGGHGGREATVRAAFSTTSLPVALGESISKRAMDAYQQTPATWRKFAQRVPLNDFREQTALRLEARNTRLNEVSPTGEIAHLQLGEQVVGKMRLKTKGAIVGISRQDIVNDDLSILANLPREMAISASETFSDDLWELILQAGSAYFSSGNGNLLTGGDSGLSVDSLADAVSKMRRQTNPFGRPISLQPAALVVPPELEAKGRSILASTEVRNAAGGPTGNPMSGIAELEVEPRLSNSTFGGNSATAWYLFASPNAAPVLAGFLGGREEPVVEQAEMAANHLGIGWRVYMDGAVSLGDYRGAVRSTGG
ncbi:MAG: Mu-like prophage major head subunit gpT family protein [Phycisphaerales bacterium]|nr:Mu-like prophage major head subunit gpT family protein [Planctomycetota bacterium]MCH8508684.1 Mu-like prophage major head subunit gpT family protein [Phycisphaerales bacterium]